jgi:large subunit ribosomal protein L6
MTQENLFTRSRVAKLPVVVPSGVQLDLQPGMLVVKGKLGQLSLRLHHDVNVNFTDGLITFDPRIETKNAKALSGTLRALTHNMVHGVSTGFVKELSLVGVGYRAQVQGKKLVLSLGYSHQIEFEAPEGVQIEAPSLTEILIKGSDKQAVGEVAAQIRRFRPPEPYKGKGVRYKNETVRIKETKKKK